MTDWDAFIESVPWFLAQGSAVSIGTSQQGAELCQGVRAKFPHLSALLDHATVTHVAVDDSRYELCSWNSINGYRVGWLCMPPAQGDNTGLFPDHQLLLRSFGGIVERSNEPEGTWLLNLNDFLTLREASNDGSFIEDYRWAFDDAETDIPIELSDYYSVSREANGNTTLCHRQTGAVILFAPDHFFDHITVIPGCPEYTLYEIDGAICFVDWVETIARQWSANVEDA